MIKSLLLYLSLLGNLIVYTNFVTIKKEVIKHRNAISRDYKPCQALEDANVTNSKS